MDADLNSWVKDSNLNNTLVISGSDQSSNRIIINSNGSKVQVNQSGSGNSKVIVNNEEVKVDGNAEVVRGGCPLLSISIPSNLHLKIKNVPELSIENSLERISIVSLRSGEVKISEVKDLHANLMGTSKLSVVKSDNTELKLNGASTAKLSTANGKMRVSSSGASKFYLNSGTLLSAEYHTEGVARIESVGTIEGSLSMSATGASRINHSGDVKGEIVKNASRAATINVN